MKRLLAALAVAGIVISCAGCRRAGESAPLVEVRRGPFEKTLSLTGTISAKETLTLSAATEGKLSFVVSEGQPVKAGDVVFALETKQMKDTLDAARIDLTVSRSSLAKAEEEIRTSKVKNDLSIRESDATLAHAQLELDRAQRDLEKKKRQVENRILPAAEIPAAELQVEQAKLGLENAQIARQKLEEEMKSGKETLALDRDAAVARLSKSQAQVTEAEDFLGKATVTAPRDGVAVHARSWRGQEWKAGDDVWQRQPVIELPDLSVMQVELDVHEADISDVKPGVPARIRFEAWPDLVLTGKVSDVSGVAKELRDRDGKNTGVRAFDAKIALDAQDSRLRPGMTARVELVLDRRADVLVVPIAAIRHEGDATKVVLASGESRDVKIAATSADLAVVESGLKEGDRVQVEGARPAESTAPGVTGPEPVAAPPAAPPGGAASLPQAGG